MALQVVGAGVGRTGTLSLKAGLEQVLGQPCYHMLEVFGRPDHLPMWRAAGLGQPVDWAAIMAGYGAAVDFPASLFWPELLAANPDAVIVLSTRRDSETWWQSASQTIFGLDADHQPEGMEEWFEMWLTVADARFTADWKDRDSAVAAYERHNDWVRAEAPADRLIEWHPGDGWDVLCSALGVDPPAEEFPHLNKRQDFPRFS